MIQGSFLRTKSAESAAFEIYLRTGRYISPDQISAEFEVKFNPWHDPEDGRFTYSGRGRFSPVGGSDRARSDSGTFRGGGGKFGGAGASGSWEPVQKAPTRPSAPPMPKRAAHSAVMPKATVKVQTSQPVSTVPHSPPLHAPPPPKAERPKVAQTAPAPSETPYRHVERNGYEYDIDEKDRTRHVQGEILTTKPEKRSRRAQLEAGLPDRLDTDDGGHYIAARFGGPGEAFNHFAQDSNLNRGKYRAIEAGWAKNIADGERVFVEITPHYHGSSKRPYSLDVTWYVGTERYYENLPNERWSK